MLCKQINNFEEIFLRRRPNGKSELDNINQQCVVSRHFLLVVYKNLHVICVTTPDNDVVLWKISYNSRSQDINYHAKIESCYTIQKVE